MSLKERNTFTIDQARSVFRSGLQHDSMNDLPSRGGPDPYRRVETPGCYLFSIKCDVINLVVVPSKNLQTIAGLQVPDLCTNVEPDELELLPVARSGDDSLLWLYNRSSR